MDKKKVMKFIGITYLIAWTVQIIVSVIYVKNQTMTGRLIFQGGLVVCMFVPLVSALIVNHGLKGMGWKPKFKGCIRWIFFGAYASLPLVIAGMALFFVIFPDLLDMNGSYVIKTYEDMGIDFNELLATSGMDYKTYILAQGSSLLYAPFINMFAAIGEEAGWRGFLYPEMEKGIGKVKTWIFGGIIWAAFHFPCMLIAGYEYGLHYMGALWLGPVVFSLFCISAGVLAEIIYDKTGCIWYPALLHGSINALGTVPQLVMNADDPDRLEKYMILGPAPNGLIAMIPLIILAVIMGIWAVRAKKDNSYI